MEFKELSNPWSQYELPDGTKIRIRHVLTAVKRTGTNDDGSPRYDCSFSAIAVTEPPVTQEAGTRHDSHQFGRANAANALGVLMEMPLIKKTDLQ